MNTEAEIFLQKQTLREEIRLRRNYFIHDAGAEDFLLQIKKLCLDKYKVFASYVPLSFEADVSLLNEYLLQEGKILGLPEVVANDKPLVFRRRQSGDAMVKGRLGIAVPVGEEVIPEVIFLPLEAFDLQGNRLGKGGGFYDRTLQALPNALRIGVAFSAQEVSVVPVLANDEKLHIIVTEKELRFI